MFGKGRTSNESKLPLTVRSFGGSFDVRFRGINLHDSRCANPKRRNSKEKRKGDRLGGKRLEEVAEGGAARIRRCGKTGLEGTRFPKVELPRVRK